MATLRRHARFLAALAVGLAIWALVALPPDSPMRALMAVNGFFVAYLGLMLRLTLTTTVDDLRRHAAADDEGSVVIVLLAIAVVGISLSAIFLVLHSDVALTAKLFALAAAPLGWATVQVLAAYRYAHLYYAKGRVAGLEFPGTKTPSVWDFLYFSFTIGMTAQVSDVQVTGSGMRRVVLLHGVASFFYNTVILALAVNAGLNMGK
jgi:uncharacterized membrane protein